MHPPINTTTTPTTTYLTTNTKIASLNFHQSSTVLTGNIINHPKVAINIIYHLRRLPLPQHYPRIKPSCLSTSRYTILQYLQPIRGASPPSLPYSTSSRSNLLHTINNHPVMPFTTLKIYTRIIVGNDDT
ncbi:hypothetical protein RND81_03G011800 [Saponaria officinalis]|uniref:Uncharacterized protein n=1 Tax=Saponaria officinalis TaxID=3572 RepID=A0AAW1M4F7_SAPOF